MVEIITPPHLRVTLQDLIQARTGFTLLNPICGWLSQFNRVKSGGSWGDDAGDLRSADIDFSDPSSSNFDLGFRLVKTK